MNSDIYLKISHGIAEQDLGLSGEEMREVSGMSYLENEEQIFPNFVARKEFEGTYRTIAGRLHAGYLERKPAK